MQYMRLTKKAIVDLVKGRGSKTENISKIIYYAGVQNIIFYSLQSAMFALGYGSNEDDEELLDKKQERIANNMVDGILRGMGIGGGIIATAKNMVLRFIKEDAKDYNADYNNVAFEMLNISPPLGSKVRKLSSAGKTYGYNKDVIREMDLMDLDNPVWEAIGNTVSATSNIPLDRVINKTKNISEALNAENSATQRVALTLGWNRWDLGVENKEVEAAKVIVKARKKVEAKDRAKIKKEKKAAEKTIETEKIIKKEVADEKKREKEGKEVDTRCSGIRSDGSRCGIKVDKAGDKCTLHDKEVTERKDGKKVQCKHIKKDKKRCGMETSASSGFCFYHD